MNCNINTMITFLEEANGLMSCRTKYIPVNGDNVKLLTDSFLQLGFLTREDSGRFFLTESGNKFVNDLKVLANAKKCKTNIEVRQR